MGELPALCITFLACSCGSLQHVYWISHQIKIYVRLNLCCQGAHVAYIRQTHIYYQYNMIYLRGAFRKVHGEDTSSRAVWKGISEGLQHNHSRCGEQRPGHSGGEMHLENAFLKLQLKVVGTY